MAGIDRYGSHTANLVAHIPTYTTTERDALTPTNGMVIYNSTTSQMEAYDNGAWRVAHKKKCIIDCQPDRREKATTGTTYQADSSAGRGNVKFSDLLAGYTILGGKAFIYHWLKISDAAYIASGYVSINVGGTEVTSPVRTTQSIDFVTWIEELTIPVAQFSTLGYLGARHYVKTSNAVATATSLLGFAHLVIEYI